MKIVTAFLKYDYGIESRGPSGELHIILPEVIKCAPDTVPFWLEEHGFPDRIDSLQDELLDFCKMQRPDYVLFMLMKDEIRVSTFDRLRSFTKPINFFCDDQWRFDDYSSRIAPHLSAIITVDKFSVPKYRALGCEKVIHTQWAASRCLPIEDKPYEFEISFVGGRNPVRDWYIGELGKNGIHVECFGAGWENGKVSFDRMNEIFARSKISLNLSNSIPHDFAYFKTLLERRYDDMMDKRRRLFQFYRIKGYRTAIRRYIKAKKEHSLLPKPKGKTVEQIKARNFEIPAAGGFQISQFALEIDDYFANGKEIVLFTNVEELLVLIKYYLENDHEREEIRKAGHAAAMKNLYSDRFSAIFKELSC